MSASTSVADSGDQSIAKPSYKYRYYYNNNGSSTTTNTIVVLLLVGTAMSASDYANLGQQTVAQNKARGGGVIFCVVDHNPGSWYNPGGAVKLSGQKAAQALDDLVQHLSERLTLASLSSSPSIFIGGHSAGGSAVIDAMMHSLLNFPPQGYIGVDPYGTQPFKPASNISKKHIDIPTLAFGFTATTCAVQVNEAGKAAYQVSPHTDRALVQIQNPKNGHQITHCIFTDHGCGRSVCPSHSQGAWVRQVAGGCIAVFVSKSHASYESIVGDHPVNLFQNSDVVA